MVFRRSRRLLSSRLVPLRSIAAALLIALSSPLRAQDASWDAPFPAFRIADNLYYVGTRGLASYLITSSQGHILINSGLESSVPRIKASVEQLGFTFGDIRVLLISHAHWDHDAGSALVKRMTGAQYMVMDGDVSVVESGGKTDFHYGDPTKADYPAAKVDRVLHDGDTVLVGANVLIARLTPGHTKGCTTWTMSVRNQGKTYSVAIVGSPNVNPGFKLLENDTYPSIARDYQRTFRVLDSLRVDIFLGAHGSYFAMEAKYARWKRGDKAAFIDRDGYREFVKDREGAFRRELAKQRATQRVP
jgi:metallo-beta-lactamase class B